MVLDPQAVFDWVFNWSFYGWTLGLFVHFIAFGLGYAVRAVEMYVK